MSLDYVDLGVSYTPDVHELGQAINMSDVDKRR